MTHPLGYIFASDYSDRCVADESVSRRALFQAAAQFSCWPQLYAGLGTLSFRIDEVQWSLLPLLRRTF